MLETGERRAQRARWRRLPLIAAVAVALLALYAAPPANDRARAV